jgi:hypothetical protein
MLLLDLQMLPTQQVVLDQERAHTFLHIYEMVLPAVVIEWVVANSSARMSQL